MEKSANLRRAEAAEAFNQHENRSDAERVISSLVDGFNVLSNTLYRRVHSDVERIFGMDSMLAPISLEQSEKIAKLEIELYQMAVSAEVVQQHGYITGDSDWYLKWLIQLRLGVDQSGSKADKRLAVYMARSPRQRQLLFTDVLAKVVATSRRTPLVLFHLVSLAVEIVTAQAFGDSNAAAEARNRQIDYLPAIRDCRECRGGILENGEQCQQCGNPLWKFDWLMASD
ncbi:MAG: hypothetical protein JXM70_13135 [Pirellulales bacterium]|nr:hypothetical protein [Pirellulales bacterium]